MYIYIATSLLLLRLIHALEVAPNSECSSLCDDDVGSDPGIGESSHTKTTDLVCYDDEYAGPNVTVLGRKFKDCLTCELTSTATDWELSKEYEVYWLLFNMKLTFDWCVFAYPNNQYSTTANEQCGDVCSGPNNCAKVALVDRMLITNLTALYRYCEDGDGAFSKIADDCVKCLDKVPNAKVLANYANALKAACNQQPGPGETLKLDFDVFPPVSTQTSSASTASTPTVPEAGTLTVTAHPAYPPPSSPAALTAASSAQAAASESAAASAKNRHDQNVRFRVGVGVGVSGPALILAVVAVILWRHRIAQKLEKVEGEARAKGEAGPPHHHDPQQEPNDQVAEPGETYRMAGADHGRPRDPELPGSELPGSELPRYELPSRDTPRTLHHSSYSMSRLVGKLAVLSKDMTQDARRRGM